MMARLFPAAAVALGALVAQVAPVHAEDRPNLQPTRDVAVEYKILKEGPSGAPDAGPQTMKLFYSAQLGAMRMESGGAGYAILDRKAHTMTMVMPQQHMYMTTANPGDDKILNPGPDTHFTRAGTATVAGLSCTVWKVQSKEGDGEGCITDDGVMLRAEGNSKDSQKGGGLEAVSVTYAPQPASLFAPPAGYTKFDPSQMRRPGAPNGAPMGPPGKPPG